MDHKVGVEITFHNLDKEPSNRDIALALKTIYTALALGWLNGTSDDGIEWTVTKDASS